MMVRSKFQGLVMVFEHVWQCPHCTHQNVVRTQSPHTQHRTRCCAACENEYDIIVDMEGVRSEKEKMVKKIGNAVLSNLVPGY